MSTKQKTWSIIVSIIGSALLVSGTIYAAGGNSREPAFNKERIKRNEYYYTTGLKEVKEQIIQVDKKIDGLKNILIKGH